MNPNAAFQRCVLDRLIELGAELAEAAVAQVRLGGVVGEGVTAFEHVARCVRRSIMLAQRLDQAAAQDKQRGRVQAATRREVIRRVEDKIQQRVAGDDAERLERELYERLDAPDFEEGLDDRPVEEIITDLCHDLGVDNPHNLKAWKRRSPEDSAALWARAERRDGVAGLPGGVGVGLVRGDGPGRRQSG